MDIHKPKSWRGVREFLREYVIIVVGVLTALAGEQAVEWAHWRAEVAEGRTGIRREVAVLLGVALTRRAQSDCIERRAAQLEAWLDSYSNGKPVQPTQPIGMAVNFPIVTQSWDMFNSSPAALHMPTRERDEIGYEYVSLRGVGQLGSTEQAAWNELQDFNSAPPLDAAARMRLRGLIARIRLTNAAMQYVIGQALQEAPAIGVTKPDAVPGPTNLGGRDMTFGLCRPLFD